jgi:seryl-tRNA synthetase
MHDIKWIRENPEAFDAALKKRGLAPMSAEILVLDEERRAAMTKTQELQARRNELAKQAGQAKAKGQDAEPLFAESREVGAQLKAMEEALAGDDPLKVKLEAIPNVLDEDVPVGADESGNVEVKHEGQKRTLTFAAKEHFDLGEALGQMDFETAAKMSGARFVLLSGALARMERALASFMLDQHTQKFGYTEIVPPYMVRDNAAYGTGQLPKFEEDLFKTTNGYYLIPTAEIPLTNIVADDILEAEELPRRYTAYTPCFRSEAGSAGRDTRGMIRQHQFSKVELVSIVPPEMAKAEHERMLSAAENILQKLGLHYRVMLLCSGDTGFGAQKTYDIEVWLPGQGAYREISSCSNFGAFQARRMKARYRPVKGEKRTEFVHTLNGSGLAIGRTMVAILENYQQEDGSITIPEALVPYMGGMTKIDAVAA